MSINNSLQPQRAGSKPTLNERETSFVANGQTVKLTPELVKKYLVSGDPNNVTMQEVVMRTPTETVQYENWIKLCYQRSCGHSRFAAPIVLEVNAYFGVPKSYTKKRRALCVQNLERPTCKPDMDNIVKAVADALNGVAYRDDSGIVEIHADVWQR